MAEERQRALIQEYMRWWDYLLLVFTEGPYISKENRKIIPALRTNAKLGIAKALTEQIAKEPKPSSWEKSEKRWEERIQGMREATYWLRKQMAWGAKQLPYERLAGRKPKLSPEKRKKAIREIALLLEQNLPRRAVCKIVAGPLGVHPRTIARIWKTSEKKPAHKSHG